MARRRNISRQTKSVLAALLEDPQKWRYGYELSKVTTLKSGTLYPLLMRLHDQGLLESAWRDAEQPGRPPRHIYRLTRDGVSLALEHAASDSKSAVLLQPLGAET